MHKSGVEKWLVSEVTVIYIDARTVAKPMSSGARSEGVRDAVRPIGSSSPLAKGPHVRSTVVHGWICTCNVTKELEAGGTDDVCERWLVSTSADLFIRNAGRPGNA